VQIGTVNGQQKIHKNSVVENFKYTKYKFMSQNLEVNKIMHFAIYLYIMPISRIAIYCPGHIFTEYFLGKASIQWLMGEYRNVTLECPGHN